VCGCLVEPIMMTLDNCLEKRRHYEAAAFFLMTTLFGLVHATSKIIENTRAGLLQMVLLCRAIL